MGQIWRPNKRGNYAAVLSVQVNFSRFPNGRSVLMQMACQILTLGINIVGLVVFPVKVPVYAPAEIVFIAQRGFPKPLTFDSTAATRGKPQFSKCLFSLYPNLAVARLKGWNSSLLLISCPRRARRQKNNLCCAPQTKSLHT